MVSFQREKCKSCVCRVLKCYYFGNVTVDCGVSSVKCSYGNFVKSQCDSQVLITTAADDTFCDVFPNFRKQK